MPTAAPDKVALLRPTPWPRPVADPISPRQTTVEGSLGPYSAYWVTRQAQHALQRYFSRYGVTAASNNALRDVLAATCAGVPIYHCRARETADLILAVFTHDSTPIIALSDLARLTIILQPVLRAATELHTDDQYLIVEKIACCCAACKTADPLTEMKNALDDGFISVTETGPTS